MSKDGKREGQHGVLWLKDGPVQGPSRRSEHGFQEKVGTLSEPQNRCGGGLDGSGRGHGLHVPGDQELRECGEPNGEGAGRLASPKHGRHGGEAAVHSVGGGEERCPGRSPAHDRSEDVIVVFSRNKR